jgi:hypothetical protein
MLPTGRIRRSLIATAWAIESCESTVITVLLSNILSAAYPVAEEAVAVANTPLRKPLLAMPLMVCPGL